MRRSRKVVPPLSERLLSPSRAVARDAEIELRDRVIKLLVAGGFVTWEKVDESFNLAKSLK